MIKAPKKNLSDLCAAAKEQLDQSDLNVIHIDLKAQENALKRAQLYAEIKRRLESLESGQSPDSTDF